MAQKVSGFEPVTRRIMIHSDTSVIQAEVLPAGESMRIQNSAYYTWFAGGRLHVTKGGFDGRLLHGSFALFTYPEKNLIQKGSFRNGEKSGLWTTWYPHGEVKERIHWKAGKRAGRFVEFDENGFRSREGRYRNNELHGLIRVYVREDSVEVIRMKNGKLVTRASWYARFFARINKRVKKLFRSRKNKRNTSQEPAAPQTENP